jgi:hypothetical protein
MAKYDPHAPTGTCYPDAVKIARKLNDPVTVVHGKVWQAPEKKWINHAWVEHEGKVYDSIFPEGIDARRYERLLKPKAAHRYDKWKAVALCVGKGHWGPWGLRRRRRP